MGEIQEDRRKGKTKSNLTLPKTKGKKNQILHFTKPLLLFQAELAVEMQSAEKEARERGISMYPSDEDEESFGKCGSPPLQNAAAEMQTPDQADRS